MKEKKSKVAPVEKIPSLAVKEVIITAEGWKRRMAVKPKPAKKKK